MTTLRVTLVLLAFLGPAIASAKTVTWAFTGLVDESDGPSTGIFADAPNGTPLSGTISFDDRLAERVNGGTVDGFSSHAPINNQALADAWRATLTVNDITLTQTISNPAILQATLSLIDELPGTPDRVTYEMIRTSPTILGNDFFALRFIDPTGTAVGAGGGGLTGTIEGAIALLDALDLADFDTEASPLSRWRAWDETDQDLGRVVFRITSFTRVGGVPSAPSPLWLLVALLGAGLAGIRAASASPSRRPTPAG